MGGRDDFYGRESGRELEMSMRRGGGMSRGGDRNALTKLQLESPSENRGYCC